MKPQELFLYKLIPSNRDAFAQRVIDIANSLRTNPHWLMLVMWFESKLNAAAKNPFGSASGLIQFTEATAKGLGTTTEELRNMSNVDQLRFVYKYFSPYTGKLNSLVDVYLSVFYPKYRGASSDVKVSLSEKWVQANKIFDINGDGVITVGEIKSRIEGYYDNLKKKYPPLLNQPQTTAEKS